MADNRKPAQSGYSRIFLIEGGAGPGNAPSFQSCAVAGAVEQSFGDVTDIECPDPNRYGQFIKVGRIRGEVGRATTELMNLFDLNLRSEFLRLAKLGCRVDIQIHFGDCKDPSRFNEYSKALVLRDVVITNYATDPLGAMQSADQAKVNETVQVSATEIIEIGGTSFAKRAEDIVTNEVVDVVNGSTQSCGDCDEPDNGCEKLFSVTIAAGGSLSTPADLVYSLDGGATWYAHDIDTLGVAENPTGIEVMGDYVVVVSSDSNSLHYTDRDLISRTADPAWTEVNTGFVASKQPRDVTVSGNYMFVAGNGGYVYGTGDPTTGVDVLDAGVAVIDNLLAVHAMSEEYAVAVGNSGAVIRTTNQQTWAAVTRPVAPGINLTSVYMQSTDLWWVTASNGRLYYTTNGGTSWTEKAFTGSGTGTAYDVVFINDTVGYLSHSTTAPRARLLKTIDGGHSWFVLPEGNTSLPLADRINALAACRYDANFVVGVGLADNATDGYIVAGSGT
jgi:photosystem II stability/assembly factor-like uncharacterized protein